MVALKFLNDKSKYHCQPHIVVNMPQMENKFRGDNFAFCSLYSGFFKFHGLSKALVVGNRKQHISMWIIERIIYLISLTNMNLLSIAKGSTTC